jgi:hypothetical protein
MGQRKSGAGRRQNQIPAGIVPEQTVSFKDHELDALVGRDLSSEDRDALKLIAFAHWRTVQIFANSESLSELKAQGATLKKAAKRVQEILNGTVLAYQLDIAHDFLLRSPQYGLPTRRYVSDIRDDLAVATLHVDFIVKAFEDDIARNRGAVRETVTDARHSWVLLVRAVFEWMVARKIKTFHHSTNDERSTLRRTVRWVDDRSPGGFGQKFASQSAEIAAIEKALKGTTPERSRDRKSRQING